MRTADFDFVLPEERIAQHPVEPRDAARLLSIAKATSHRVIADLPEILKPSDILVVNDTRVIPAHLIGKRGEARISLNLIKPLKGGLWLALARPAKKLKPGDQIIFAQDFSAHVTERHEGEVRLDFGQSPEKLTELLIRYGHTPLPPYIKRDKEGEEATDRERYQTVFACREGAVAAPTAGLHFTPELLARLKERGVETVHLTLHVGAGTFLPVKSDNLSEHRMHAEWGEITEEAAARINNRQGRLVTVGTTSLRLLESAADAQGKIQAFSGETDIFILPGHRFRSADLLLTNFHLPRSTLFMLVSAFGGLTRMKEAYAEAIDAGYRFYSYGDACLIERNEQACCA
jgi:S-adenosylmethionine:tRNA ribosyltransferase-isomerase